MAKKSSQSKKQKSATKRPRKRKSESQQLEIDMSKLPKVSDASLRLVWVDRMEIAVRGDEPLVTLRFYSAVVDHLSEVSRIQTSVTHIKAIIDVLCRNIEYYPSRPS